MTQIRWYQQEAISSLFDYFANNSGNPLVALPTGSGKSVVIAEFLRIVMQYWPNQRIIQATHVKELVSQNFQRAQGVWPHMPAGIYSAGLKRRDLYNPITFASVQSIVKVIEQFKRIDLLIVDECHLIDDSETSSYGKIIAALQIVNPKLKVIGFTATAWRTGMGLLTNGPIFTDICYNLCTREGFRRLFDEGFLVPPRAKRVDVAYDTSEIGTVGGDFAQGKLNAVTKNQEVTWAALRESVAKGKGRNCRLVFCTGIEHAIMARDMLLHMGLKAEAVHSKMPEAERDRIMTAFFSGEIDTLTNNGICTTGVDHPPIDHIIMLRPTQSVGLWVQMLGRGTRPFECNGWYKEDCLVTDHGRNCERLGTIDNPFIPKLHAKGAGDCPVKICPACGTYNHAAARECDECGQPFEQHIKYTEKSFEGPLVSSDLPVMETFAVGAVYYTRYIKRNAAPGDKPSIKATYQCGLQRFVEYVAIEAKGFALHKARDWWKQRYPDNEAVPTTVDEAMQYVDKLVPPKAIKVWVNKKYPEIVAHEY